MFLEIALSALYLRDLQFSKIASVHTPPFGTILLIDPDASNPFSSSLSGSSLSLAFDDRYATDAVNTEPFVSPANLSNHRSVDLLVYIPN